jgi:hypothetical protein
MPGLMLTPSRIEHRMPVWHALSDLFLDTELQPADYERIAAALRRSGYSTGELRTILDEEVLPAFAFNLLAIAGEWVPWGEEEVRAIMLRSLRARRRPPLGRWLLKRLHGHYLEAEWAKISASIGPD